MRLELDRLAAAPPPRWNANPDDVRKSVLKLVLTLVDFIRQILERQAIRRMWIGRSCGRAAAASASSGSAKYR